MGKSPRGGPEPLLVSRSSLTPQRLGGGGQGVLPPVLCLFLLRSDAELSLFSLRNALGSPL